MKDFEKNRLSGLFSNNPARRALMMSGCAIASWYFGVVTPDLIDLLHEGFTYSTSMVPLANPIEIAANYFNGAMSWFGSVAVGAAEKFSEYGGVLSDQMAGSIESIRHDISLITTNAREFFHHVGATSREVATMWRNTISDAIYPIKEFGQNIFEMIPDNPVDAAKAFGKIMTRAVEAFGVAKGLHEAYKFTMDKFIRRGKKDPEIAEAAERSGLSVGAVTNMTINISVAGDAAAERACDQIENVLAAGNEKIVIDKQLLKDTLDDAISADKAAANRERVEKAMQAFLEGEVDVVSSDMSPRRSIEKDTGILKENDILLTSARLNRELKSSVARQFELHDEYLNRPGSYKPVNSVAASLIRSARDPLYIKGENQISGIDAKKQICDTDVKIDTPSLQ